MIFKKNARLIINAIKSGQGEPELKSLIDSLISDKNTFLAMLTIGYAVYYANEKDGSEIVKFIHEHYCRGSTPRYKIIRYSIYLGEEYHKKNIINDIIEDICEKPFTSNSRLTLISQSIFFADTERKRLILTILEQKLKEQIEMATYTIVDECYNIHLAKSLKELARRCYQSNASIHVEMVGLPAGSELAGKRIHIENEKKLVSFLTKLYADGSPTVNVFETEDDTDWFYKIQKH